MYNLSVLLKIDLPLIMQEPYSGVHRKCVYLPPSIKNDVDTWCNHQDGIMKNMLIEVSDVESHEGYLFIEDAMNVINEYAIGWKKELVDFYFSRQDVWSYKRNVNPTTLKSHVNFICKSLVDRYIHINYPMLSPLLCGNVDEAGEEYINMLIMLI